MALVRVSIPLRGNDRKREATEDQKVNLEDGVFPSPCGEMIGKEAVYYRRKEQIVSIPLRGNDRKRLDSVTYTQQSLKSSFSTDMQIIADK